MGGCICPMSKGEQTDEHPRSERPSMRATKMNRPTPVERWIHIPDGTRVRHRSEDYEEVGNGLRELVSEDYLKYNRSTTSTLLYSFLSPNRIVDPPPTGFRLSCRKIES